MQFRFLNSNEGKPHLALILSNSILYWIKQDAVVLGLSSIYIQHCSDFFLQTSLPLQCIQSVSLNLNVTCTNAAYEMEILPHWRLRLHSEWPRGKSIAIERCPFNLGSKSIDTLTFVPSVQIQMHAAHSKQLSVPRSDHWKLNWILSTYCRLNRPTEQSLGRTTLDYKFGFAQPTLLFFLNLILIMCASQTWLQRWQHFCPEVQTSVESIPLNQVDFGPTKVFAFRAHALWGCHNLCQVIEVHTTKSNYANICTKFVLSSFWGQWVLFKHIPVQSKLNIVK